MTTVTNPIPALKKQRLAYLAALLRETADSCSLSPAMADDEFRRQARAWLGAGAWFNALEREVEELLAEETPQRSASAPKTPFEGWTEAQKELSR